MASVSVSHLVLFIASMIVASAVGVTFVGQADQLAAALGQKGDDVSKDIRTDIEIISDPGSPVYNTSGNGNVTVLVKNTGSREISRNDELLDVLIDGDYKTNVTLTVVDGEVWGSTNVARLEINASDLPSGDHRLNVIVNGDEEVFEFRT